MSKPTNKQLQKALREYVKKQQRHSLKLFGTKAIDEKIENIFKDHQKEVEKIYRDWINGKVDTNKPFKLSDYPNIKTYFEPIRESLQVALYNHTINSIKTAWTQANNDIEPIIKTVFPNTPTNRLEKYLSHNEAAKEAFIKRNISKGRTLKGRTWLMSNKYLREVEETIAIGINKGDSAVNIGKRIAEYLEKPEIKADHINKLTDVELKKHLQKRQIEEAAKGSKAPKSVKKQAQRLVANETNLAYRNAETEKIDRLDFVVGYEIKTSNSHQIWLQKYWIPRYGSLQEVCDAMAGKYPKTFKWNSWHPNCKCYRVPIIKTISEITEDNLLILEGKEPTTKSVNAVTDLSKHSKEWLKMNHERFSKYKNKPYFYEDNIELIKQIVG
ncbi:hypothetical protein [Dysgonomonas massiliensis]|uniref:hypothetical protein n=1 Tax=Dysgonomonas massiliensis TaxID=2040292 RepID=UPI000C7609DB|nr:hypothetical protein [Dysgonomonas massiliensis]